MRANLNGDYLFGARLMDANLSGASLKGADLTEANLQGANLSGANLTRAQLWGANFTGANLSGADLSESILKNSTLVKVKIDKAIISRSQVYGISLWDLIGKFEEQNDLIITDHGMSSITVDNIKIAQFVYLILNNEEIRDVINTLTSKTVLILGRFSVDERKTVLEALKDKLREYRLLPIVFDFDRATDKDYTETIITLAGLWYFVIADITSPKSTPLELQATVPLLQVPFVPIIQKGQRPFAMMTDLQTKYNWVLPTRTYSSKESLIKGLEKGIIEPAMQKHNELRLVKAQKPDTVSLDKL